MLAIRPAGAVMETLKTRRARASAVGLKNKFCNVILMSEQ